MISDIGFYYHPHTYETVPSAQLGLGLLMLATYAKNLGASVRVVNAQADQLAAGLERLPRCRYLCLYGCMVDAPIINEVARRAVENKKTECVVVGGPIAKSGCLLDVRWVDLAVDGFGEDLMEDMVAGADLLAGSVSQGGGLTEAPPLLVRSELRRNINEYPYPDRTLIDGSKGGRIFHGTDAGYQSSTILTSRGCRYRCAFCSSGDGRKPQDYTMDRIGREVEECAALGITALRISDDNIVNDPGRMEQLCRVLHANGMAWRASIRVKPSSVELYRMMREHGCQELSFGVESGDQRVLNTLRKGTKVEHNVAAIRNAQAAGIGVTRALMMMCTPGETLATLNRNMMWYMQAKPDVVSLKVFVPYPGTAIYNNPDKFHCILEKTRDYNNSAYRPDGSEAESNISLPGVMGRSQLTKQFHQMKEWVEKQGAANYG